MSSRLLSPNPRKTLSVRPLCPVDIERVREDILAIPEAVWNREDAEKPNQFGSLDTTRHIVFRFVANFGDWRQSYELPLWEEWRERLTPLLQLATSPYGYARGGFPRIMLARMAPGGVIHPHVDANPSARWPHKIHIPIQTNPEVRFYVEPKEYHLEAGHAYEINNMMRHAVRNEGSTDRIHLIFEYYDVDQPIPDGLPANAHAAGA